MGAMFGVPRPLEVELGSGDGSFLLAWATAHPERNFIGIERLLGRIRKLDRQGRRAGLGNLRGLRIEAAYALEYLLPPESAEAVHVYFPDPWPKRRHHKNRLINEGFPGLANRVLKAGGVVHLRTDDGAYFERMREVFEGEGGRGMFEEVPTPEGLVAVTTDFEREFLARGIATRRASYRKVGGGVEGFRAG
ncbi:MAG: tRNA (guanosine(46)-N7)-methyltransferase TrmB [Verrucomicrobiae bacterium]|nr:tRNA (guanosine(46)-N7)-methyltransferase TrmB [Verrucomicrobiae bacterium]